MHTMRVIPTRDARGWYVLWHDSSELLDTVEKIGRRSL